jgi:hypothetical protein
MIETDTASYPGLMPRDVSHWEPDPPTARPTHGAPALDIVPWWRLEPSVRGEDGTMVRRSVIHGGTCIDWPAGRHPRGWTFHTRPEVRRLLSRPDEVIPCPKCRPWIGL